MDAFDFLHHGIPLAWAGIEPATLSAEGQRQTNNAIQPATFGHFDIRRTNTQYKRVQYEESYKSTRGPIGNGPSNFELWFTDEGDD
ncbi:hypothetical protein TNCV_931851 [Trichonephila clavipes]|nr:hypothetical protein TNCV_931851 [Trichonephila clavipes]